jgi:hypothetical protein
MPKGSGTGTPAEDVPIIFQAVRAHLTVRFFSAANMAGVEHCPAVQFAIVEKPTEEFNFRRESCTPEL